MKLLFLLSFIFRAASQLVQKVTVIGGAYSVIFRIGDPAQTTTLTTSLSKEFTYVSPFVFKKEYCQSYVSAGMMDITPTVVTIVFVFIFKDREITTWASFLSWVFVYAIVYVPLFYLFSMNKDAKRLMLGPVRKLLRR